MYGILLPLLGSFLSPAFVYKTC